MKIIVLSKNNQGDEFQIQEGNNLIGRWDPQDKSFPEIDLEELDVDAKVSRRHCVIYNEINQAFIEDLASLNGTFLNSKKINSGEKLALNNGDEIMIGKIMFKFQS